MVRDIREEQRRQAMFAEADYCRLETDLPALTEYLAEISVWEVTSNDGLEPEGWSTDLDQPANR